MNFLLVNDDGYGSQGILLVEKILKKYGNVYVVAPKLPQSAKGCSLIFQKEIEFEKVDEFHYIIDGTPVMCTSFGVNVIPNIDIVISGCNNGLNISLDTMYSGTVGACVEALFNGFSAIALSCDLNFNIVEKELDSVLNHIFNNKLYSKEYILNVNFPNVSETKGIKISSMHKAKVKYDVLFKDKNHYSIYRCEQFDNPKKNSDVYDLMNGYISICPLRQDLFSLDSYNKLK